MLNSSTKILNQRLAKMADFIENISLKQGGEGGGDMAPIIKDSNKNNTEKKAPTEAERQRIYTPSLTCVHQQWQNILVFSSTVHSPLIPF